MKLNLPVHSYDHRSTPASSARLVNCHPEMLPAGAATPVIITRAPGIKDWITVGNGPIRGMYAPGRLEYAVGNPRDQLYVVSGPDLFLVTRAGGKAYVGSVGTATRIDISSNTDSLVIVNEPRAYYYKGATLAEITDDDFVSRGAGDIEFLDNFMCFREPDSNRWFIADIGSTSDFDALQFAKCDDAPDQLVGMKADHGLMLNFGAKTLEMWENTGASGFTFERIVNGTIEVGCLNAKTIGRVFNQILWVSDDYMVRRLDGINPSIVSTHAINQKLAKEAILESFTYEHEGHGFYCLTTAESTYVFDVVTQEWSERKSHGQNNWKPRYHAQFDGKELVADWNSNKVGYLDYETYTEWGEPQRMEWTYQNVYASGQRAFHDRLEIVLETGVGTTTGQGQDPQIMLQKSDDGGKTWQSLPDRSFGKLGKRQSRAVWHNLGSARNRVYKAAVSDPVAVTVRDTILEVKGGRL